MEFPESGLLEILEERACAASPSCTSEAVLFTRTSKVLKEYFWERYTNGNKAYQAEFRQNYPQLYAEFERLRKAG